MELHKQGPFGKDQISKLEFCEHCVRGKQTRVKFQNALHRTKNTLDYVHSDVWGPSKTLTHCGSRYFISFIHDYSRRLCLYAMKHKNEALKKFGDWKALVENQTGKKIKRLRTDNGVEYLNH